MTERRILTSLDPNVLRNGEKGLVQLRDESVTAIVEHLIQQGLVERDQRGKKLLDLGAFLGTSAFALRKYGFKFTLVEDGRRWINEGRERGLILPEDKVHVARAEDFMETHGEVYDWVTYFGMPHWLFHNRIIPQLRRLLRNGGVYVCSSTYRSEADAQDIINKYGGSEIELNDLTIHRWDKFIYFKKFEKVGR